MTIIVDFILLFFVPIDDTTFLIILCSAQMNEISPENLGLHVFSKRFLTDFVCKNKEKWRNLQI